MSELLWETLREAGYEPTEESRARARARLERAESVTAEATAESRESVREIMGWS
jgi:hypothetical protein